ncbi:MAG: aminotransferase class I/II-fold pyridoxal phosphate-dependent enzyme, partial [Eudoraea sp.]|nr:aminotransferase class I/II-fold pyridoxal phosphate-dependent enzyme [Eudoraea sp.]
MTGLPKKLEQKLEARRRNNNLRSLAVKPSLIDFSTNDYLGFSKNRELGQSALRILSEHNVPRNGATGSRLLTGNNDLYSRLEGLLCNFHNSKSALVFNSGYDANIGFFSSVPQRNDIVFYDEYVHASIRDGLKMGNARAYKFRHNDFEDLQSSIFQKEHLLAEGDTQVYLVTESVFSMDGDAPRLAELCEICERNKIRLVIDEAHAIGVLGEGGRGMIYDLGLEQKIFARIITFGKAFGCHGAAVLGADSLKTYLVNFARSLIYTTGLPPHSLASILAAYGILQSEFGNQQQQL